ncbi:DUF4870 domain-containing protein [Cellulophaga sp. Hel_I_12]|uniref:DUF4870 domain-containing protein n=1 Tax=Cellulophaga sp. Hel_I_12 TaxID=1249972 RepID=UPI000647C6D8|nr:DUF4870 domain-containing protein [Cellulophaga sp. Hel_I_12]
MTDTLSKHEKNLSALLHASTFSKFFFPFGNFIVPLVLWTANKNEYRFVDYNGKQVLNFQLSLLLYAIVLGLISVPLFIGFLPNIFEFGNFSFGNLNDFNRFNFHFNSDAFRFGSWLIPLGITGLLHTALFVLNIVYTILGVIKTNEGEKFSYPLTIKFIK